MDNNISQSSSNFIHFHMAFFLLSKRQLGENRVEGHFAGFHLTDRKVPGRDP
jgi:hypothetical protein